MHMCTVVTCIFAQSDVVMLCVVLWDVMKGSVCGNGCVSSQLSNKKKLTTCLYVSFKTPLFHTFL